MDREATSLSHIRLIMLLANKENTWNVCSCDLWDWCPISESNLKQSEKCWNAWKMSLIMEKHFLSGLMCTLCKSWSQTKTSLNFKAGYHVKYTFNAPTGIIVIAEHQFAMFGAMYLWEVTWQQINSWSHWDLMLSLAACVCMCVFLSVES